MHTAYLQANSRRCTIFLVFFMTVCNILETKSFGNYGYQHNCAMNDLQGSPGTTKLLSDCPAAISNLRAGINPTIVAKVNKQSLVCCPNVERISKRKCREFSAFTPSLLTSPYQLSQEAYLPPAIEINKPQYPVYAAVNGQAALMGQLPHMVAIGYCSVIRNNRNRSVECEYKCGGTLISENYVLSAAHCVTNSSRPRTVLLGDNQLKWTSEGSKYRKIVRIKKIIIHPERKYKYNDIALFELAQPVKLSKFARPACLPQPEDRLEVQRNFSGYEVLLSAGGWGYTSGVPGNRTISNTLQVVNLKRTPQKTCEDHFNDHPQRAVLYPSGILRSQFCAGDSRGGHQDTCNGDSGGGIVLDHSESIDDDKEKLKFYYLIGITSFGSVDCSGTEPGVYTNVQSYLDWIESIVWPY